MEKPSSSESKISSNRVKHSPYFQVKESPVRGAYSPFAEKGDISFYGGNSNQSGMKDHLF